MTFFRHSCAHSPHEPHGHDHSRSSVSPKDPVPKTLRTSFFLLLLLSLPEIGAGEMSLSRGLIADGLHNLLDVAGTLPLFLGLWAARRPPLPAVSLRPGKGRNPRRDLRSRDDPGQRPGDPFPLSPGAYRPCAA